jgi:hypothetical protein
MCIYDEPFYYSTKRAYFSSGEYAVYNDCEKNIKKMYLNDKYCRDFYLEYDKPFIYDLILLNNDDPFSYVAYYTNKDKQNIFREF